MTVWRVMYAPAATDAPVYTAPAFAKSKTGVVVSISLSLRL